MKKMCVFMMCGGRESEHVIGRTLDSIKPMMNYLVFQDNGIQDDAGKIVKEWCIINDVKLHYYEVEWRNPGWNRGHSYQTAKELYDEHKSDWLFRMDADEYVHYFSTGFEVSGDEDCKSAGYTNGSSRFNRSTFFNTHSNLVWDDQEAHEIPMKSDGTEMSGGLVPHDMLIIMSPPKTTIAQETELELHHRYYRESLELEKKALIREDLENWSSKDLYHLYYAGKANYDCCYWGRMDIWKNKDVRDNVISRGMWYLELWLRLHNIWIDNMDDIKTNVEYLRGDNFVYDHGYYAYLMLGDMNQFIDNSFTDSLKYYIAGNKLNPERNEINREMLNHYINIEDWSSANNVVLQMDGKDNPAQYYSAFVWDSAYLNTSQDLQSLFDLVRSKIS